MKTELVSARISKQESSLLEEVATGERTDKTAALRRLLNLGGQQYRLQKAIEQYRAGKISIGKAKDLAGISLWEFMDLLKQENVSNPLPYEAFQEGLENLEKTLNAKKL
ncbi:MAG: UPF0175 family protein [Candidatus Diapherotrites archaeon]|nr:UPF0175 family protein [Candidatus Diapherotrites archaeon]